MNKLYYLIESAVKDDKWVGDVKIKKGKMHRILGLAEDETIDSKFSSGKELAIALMDKVGNKKEVTGMLAFAANTNKENNIFDSALHYMKNIDNE